jgi:hypothetical protein
MLYPQAIFLIAILTIYPIIIVELVVPSPANLFVPSTDFFIKVATASSYLLSLFNENLQTKDV